MTDQVTDAVAADKPRLKVLLVDDDRNIRQTLLASLSAQGCEVRVAASAEEAQRLLGMQPFDLLLTDYRLEGRSGIELIQSAQALKSPPVSVMMTAYASFENAVNAIKEGAFDYLPKPFSTGQLSHLLKKVGTIVELKSENERLRRGSVRREYFSGMTSPSMARLQEFVGQVSGTDATVLLVGESGTGKSELARVIHERSNRSGGPFVTVNCTSLAESLLESELFGHVKGAFTGAVQEHVGKFELADRGTLFLDEVGDLSMGGQTKLLRFLQEKVIERVGSNRIIPVDARVIAATNRNLEEAVREGDFREDLYYRLNVFECPLVPLRFRKEDLPVLVERLIGECGARNRRVPEPVMKALMEYRWPGNIRELRNVLERLIVLSGGREMTLEDLPSSFRDPARIGAAASERRLRSLEDLEREHIAYVLSVEPNQARAAEILGITKVTLWKKRKEFGLP